MKRFLVFLMCICMLFGTAWAQANETAIRLNGDQVTVEGAEISGNTEESVYLYEQVESRDDMPDSLEGVTNRVVTIAQPGTYRVSGNAMDLQLAVRVGDMDEVRIILDGVDITCRTAPAIIVYSAKEPAVAGEYGVVIEMAAGSVNTINGSHADETEDIDVKLSGAISSLVSLGFEGDGFLFVTGDNEGIEVKFGHLTFNGGNTIVTSEDDPLNASEDGVSVITINGGTLHTSVVPENGGEGDGMDSNGSIVINGGAIVSYAHPDSADSGLDADLGCTINGGIVLGAGNMKSEMSFESEQLFMLLQFEEKVNDMIVLTDMQGEVAAVCSPDWQHSEAEGTDDTDAGYTSFVFSFPELKEGDYQLYIGGEITLEDKKMIYTPGQQLQHGGYFGGKPEMRKGMSGYPDKLKGADRPEDMGFPGNMLPPEVGGMDSGRNQEERESGPEVDRSRKSTVFHLAAGSTTFNGISIAE